MAGRPWLSPPRRCSTIASRINQPPTSPSRPPASRTCISCSAGWGDDQTISLVATVNPMVSLIWAGGIVLLAGTLISLWPDRVLAPRTAPVRMREAVAVEA